MVLTPMACSPLLHYFTNVHTLEWCTTLWKVLHNSQMHFIAPKCVVYFPVWYTFREFYMKCALLLCKCEMLLWNFDILLPKLIIHQMWCNTTSAYSVCIIQPEICMLFKTEPCNFLIRITHSPRLYTTDWAPPAPEYPNGQHAPSRKLKFLGFIPLAN